MSDRIAITRSCGCVEEWTESRIRRAVHPHTGFQEKRAELADLIRYLEQSPCWYHRLRDGNPETPDSG